MNGGRRRLKLALIALLLSVAGLAAVYQQVYPLSLTAGTGYLLQIPAVFWVFVVLALASLFFIVVLTESSPVTFGSIVGIALVLNFHNFLTYGVIGRDLRGEVSRLFFSLDKTHLSTELYSYFQWPVHFIVTQQVDRVVSLPLSDMIWMGYLAYYVLFACGIGIFAYSLTDGDTFPWFAGAIFYVVFTRQWLNNQFVPQFLGLVFLLFLFAIHGSDDPRLKLLRNVLYVLLVLTHPFFFAFYLLYVLTLPLVRAVIDTVGEIGTPERPLYYQSFESLRNVLGTLLALQSNLRRRVSASWLAYIGFLIGSYLLFFLFRFSIFKRRLFELLSGPKTESSSGKIPARVMEILFGVSRYGEGGTETVARTVLLYDLTPRMLKEFTLYGTLGVLLALIAVSTIALLWKSSSKISPSGIAIALAGAIYYAAGFVLPIVGNRAFQVLFLPFGTFLDGRDHYPKYVKAIVLVVLIASPIVVANLMANNSLGGGGNTHEYYGDEAGQFLLEYSVLERDGAVTYPAAGYPPFLTKTGETLSVTTVETIILTGTSGSETLVYGKGQEYRAEVFGHRCNFSPDRRNAIYDNSIQVLKDSPVAEPFVCRER